MLRDRGDLLKYALSDALRKAVKIVRGLRAGLPMAEREAVAEAAVADLRKLPDDPWKLAEPLPVRTMDDLGAPTPGDWCQPKP
jgi:hypothetical protein